jgi:hypothetical protein
MYINRYLSRGLIGLILSLGLLSLQVLAEPVPGAAVQFDIIDFDNSVNVKPALMPTLVVGAALTPNIALEGRVSLNVINLLDIWLYDGSSLPSRDTTQSTFRTSGLLRISLPITYEWGMYGLIGAEYLLVSTHFSCKNDFVTVYGNTQNPVYYGSKSICSNQDDSHSGLIGGVGMFFGNPERGSIGFEFLRHPRSSDGFGYSSFSIRFAKGF